METNSWVDFSVSRGPIRGDDRNKVGLLVRVKARRDVEDFMIGLGSGRRFTVDNFGELWHNHTANAGPLEVYDIGANFPESSGYTLDSVSGPLLIGGDPPQNVDELRRAAGLPRQSGQAVNLSFLRLAGISSPEGVTIGVAGAYSSDYVYRYRNLLPTMLKRFLQDYLGSVTFNLQVISRSE